jgi:dihydrofolate reductase
MKLSLIAAVAENGTIGRDNQVPWRLPLDLQWFKRQTWGHTVILGRRTLESVDSRPLPGRRNIVVSRSLREAPEGVTVVPSFEAALEAAKSDGEVFVVGGQEIYRAALPHAFRLYITRVHAQVQGDTVFPPFDESDYYLIEREDHPADERHELPFTFLIYERKGEGGKG